MNDFETQGWAVIASVISPARAGELATMASALLGHPTAPQVWQLPSACRGRPELLAHLDETLINNVSNMLGASRLRLLQDTIIIKPPGAPEVAWHRDVSYTSYLDPPRAVSIRLALTPETLATGALAVVDGSHQWRIPAATPSPSPQSDTITKGALDRLPPEQRARAASSQRTLALAAGDVSIHHSKTLHMSHPNTSAQARVTLVTHVFDADCRVVAERIPPAARQWYLTDEDGRLTGPLFPPLPVG